MCVMCGAREISSAGFPTFAACVSCGNWFDRKWHWILQHHSDYEFTLPWRGGGNPHSASRSQIPRGRVLSIACLACLPPKQNLRNSRDTRIGGAFAQQAKVSPTQKLFTKMLRTNAMLSAVRTVLNTISDGMGRKLGQRGGQTHMDTLFKLSIYK